jgi:putative cardiolipin synthase
MKVFTTSLVILLALALIIIGLRLLFPLPSRAVIKQSQAIAASKDTLLGRKMLESQARHAGKSGVLSLEDGHDALRSRLALVRLAERSIDVQYYIWHDDFAGRAILKELLDASRRGVRVRLLLDDNGISGLDAVLAALNEQADLEIRLFNPSTVRSPKYLGYAFDFFRLNRRMHNKALIVDGAAAIIGGRNIGNEYFNVGDVLPFLDLDVLAAGKVVSETGVAFDAYWNSKSSYPLELIVDSTSDIAQFEALAKADEQSNIAQAFYAPNSATVDAYRYNATEMEWTDVRLVVDDPAKGTGSGKREGLMLHQLARALGPIKKRVDVVSAYFIVGNNGTDWFAKQARAGHEVRIATNALNTTDVAAVHAGYAKYRERLLAAGVKLYEIRLGAGQKSSGSAIGSRASLHAKSFAIDGERIFIGSFNFDPRSALLNCEMGYLIESPGMAEALHQAFDTAIPKVSYIPALETSGALIWTAPQADGTSIRYDDEPESSFVQRMIVRVVGWLPIEWLL